MRRCQDAGDELEEDSDVLGVGVGVASVVPMGVGMRANVVESSERRSWCRC